MVTVHTHQELLRNIGAHEKVLTIFGLPCTGNEPRKRLFQLGYDFLEAFCWENPSNQELLFEKIELLSSHIAEENLNAADCVGAVVKDNTRLCEIIPTSVIYQYVKLIAKYGKKPHWIRQLSGLCVVKGEGLKRNQSIVLRAVLDSEDIIDLEDKSSLMEWIKDPQSLDPEKKESSQLVYYAESLNMLTAVTAGSNTYTEMQVKGMLPWSQCMEFILDLGRKPDGSLKDGIDADALRFPMTAMLDVLREAHIYVLEVVSSIKDADGAVRWWADTENPPRRCMVDEICESMREFSLLEGEAPSMQGFAQYMFVGIIPVLTMYYRYFHTHHKMIFMATELTKVSTQRICKALGELLRSHAIREIISERSKFDVILVVESIGDILEEMGVQSVINGTVLGELKQEYHQVRMILDTDGDGQLSREELMNEEELAIVPYQGFFKKFKKVFARTCGIRDLTRLMGVGMRKFATLLSEDEKCCVGLLGLLRPKNDIATLTITTGLRALRLTLFFDPLVCKGDSKDSEKTRVASMDAMVDNKPPDTCHTPASTSCDLETYVKMGYTIEEGMEVSHKDQGDGVITNYDAGGCFYGDASITVTFTSEEVIKFEYAHWYLLQTIGILEAMQLKFARFEAAEMCNFMLGHQSDEAKADTNPYPVP